MKEWLRQESFAYESPDLTQKPIPRSRLPAKPHALWTRRGHVTHLHLGPGSSTICVHITSSGCLRCTPPPLLGRNHHSCSTENHQLKQHSHRSAPITLRTWTAIVTSGLPFSETRQTPPMLAQLDSRGKRGSVALPPSYHFCHRSRGGGPGRTEPSDEAIQTLTQ